ncbi:hypothetical protein BGZ82_001418 [Podila clonocystis]|nr:hypothetical protein BGZ82_001418 [Podila clonocystis]
MVAFKVHGGQQQLHGHKKFKKHGHQDRQQFHADKKQHHQLPKQHHAQPSVNSPFPKAQSTSSAPPAPSTPSPSKDKEDPNGFRLPAKTLFNKDKVQMNWPQARPVGPGLGNMGNTCFLNSVLQCLTYTPPLAMYLLSSQHGDSCKASGFCMMCLLEKHVMRCFSHNLKESIYPKVIVGRLRNIGKQFRIGRQEDSHEFARYLIDALQKSCLEGYDSKMDNRIKETTFIHQVFGGYFQSQVKCMKCGYESNTYETYLDVSLDIKGAESVQSAFRDYIKPEILSKSNQYKCDKCKVLVNARKQMTIYDAPKILSVHLKRFTFTGQKINRHVKFDTKLELNSVMSTNKKHPELSYGLYAVLVHAGGSCHSGHYYCYVKGSNGSWFSMNDSHVSPVSLQTVLSQTAYMLFYAQEKKGSKMTNGVQGEGTKSAPVQMKRSRPDADDMEDNTKARSTEGVSKDKRVKVDERLGLGVSSELTKAERKKLKQEKKRTQMEQEKEKEKGQKPVNDYEHATSTKASSSSTSSSTTTSFASSTSTVKSIFGVPFLNGASSGSPKNQSPLADLDIKPIKVPVPKAITPVKKAETVMEGWKVIEGVPKSLVAVDSRSLQTGKSEKEYVQDGWTVRVARKVKLYS